MNRTDEEKADIAITNVVPLDAVPINTDKLDEVKRGEVRLASESTGSLAEPCCVHEQHVKS